jgi:hypothetical protein
MITTNSLGFLKPWVLAGMLATVYVSVAPAQEQLRPEIQTAEIGRTSTSFDAQLYIVIAAETGQTPSDVPQSLSGVVKQLRETLLLQNYRLGGTFINRISSDGNLQLRGVASPGLVGPNIGESPVTYDFALSGIRREQSGEDGAVIRISNFRFKLKLPVVMGTTRPDPNGPPVPLIGYEYSEVATAISLREGVPTVVGTMTTGRPHEEVVLVLLLRRNTQQ